MNESILTDLIDLGFIVSPVEGFCYTFEYE